MSAHLADSIIYGHLWATDEARALFTDAGRTQLWLDILAALAAAQAELGLIPAAAADNIAANAQVERIDLEEVGQRTRATGHSTLGLIEVVRGVLAPDAQEWFYYGATVQDVADTWTGLVFARITHIVARDLRVVEGHLLDLAEAHRDTVMVGRTHGQPGLPITFGFKAAVWADEVRRHLDRLDAARDRLAVGQLAGAVGTLAFWGENGIELQRRFCERLGLSAPSMTWLTARDRVAEFLGLLALATGTIAKIGNEITNLSRPEIGEVREPFRSGVVGSITMPHKRNPELSEHLGTLARVVRGASALALEGLVHEHERDGTAWKTEWAVLPEASMAAAAATGFAVQLTGELEIDALAMARNVAEQAGYVLSEPVMLALAERLGKHTAHAIVYDAAMAGIDRGEGFREALAADPRVELSNSELDQLFDARGTIGNATRLVDRVVTAGRGARGEARH